MLLILVVSPPTFIVLPPTLVLIVVGEEVGVILELVVLLFRTPSLDDTEENANWEIMDAGLPGNILVVD